MPRVGPRARLAARLYGSGAVPSKKAAAEAVGMSPTYFSALTNPNNNLYSPEVSAIVDEVEAKIKDKAIEMSAVMQAVGREALLTQYKLMKDTKNEAIKTKAASDLLDRNPETSKVHKVQSTNFTLGSNDAKLLADALTKAASVREQFGDAALGDYVRIPVETEDAEQGLLPSQTGQVDKGLAPSSYEPRPEASRRSA